MKKLRTFRKAWKDLCNHDHNIQQLNVSFLRFLYNVYIKNSWEILELNTHIVENAKSLPIRSFLAIAEKDTKNKEIVIQHMTIFAQDIRYLKSTLPRYFNQLLVSYTNKGYKSILFCFNNSKDTYVKYFEDNLDNINYYEKNNDWWNYINKKNYHILYFQF